VDQTVVDGAFLVEQQRAPATSAQTASIFDVAVMDGFDRRGSPQIETKGVLSHTKLPVWRAAHSAEFLQPFDRGTGTLAITPD
jgi:hypothetical protein